MSLSAITKELVDIFTYTYVVSPEIGPNEGD